MNIRLEQIDINNWFECSQLKVKPDQEQFVTSNMVCIAEVQFYPSWGAYAIYHDEKMVGFCMYEYDQEEKEWWISNLMMASTHQGRGYGRLAVEALIDLMKAKGCEEMLVGYAHDNVVAGALYRRLGFVERGIDDEGDMVSCLKL